MIMCFGIGSIILMPIAGILIAHFGTTRTVKGATILFLSTMLLLSLTPTIPLGAIAIFFFGGLMGRWIAAMNGNAVEVEKSMRRAIMSSLPCLRASGPSSARRPAASRHGCARRSEAMPRCSRLSGPCCSSSSGRISCTTRRIRARSARRCARR